MYNFRHVLFYHLRRTSVKQLGIIIAILVLLMVGGALTTQLIGNPDAGVMPVLQQTDSPDAAITEVVGWKAEQLFLAIGFILFNLVGIAVTLAVVFWFLDRGVRVSKAEAAESAKAAPPAPKVTAEKMPEKA
jgi:hypothetical protein